MPSFTFRIVLLYIALAASLASMVGVDWRLAIELTVIAAGLTPAIVRHSPRLWVASKRLQYWLTNSSTAWNATFSFDGAFSLDQLDSFRSRLLADERAGTRVLESSGERLLVHFQRTFVVEVVLHSRPGVPGESRDTRADYNALSLTILDQHVGYRRSQSILEHTVIPLVEGLKEQFRAAGGSYALRVSFEQSNPFLSLYVQQLNHRRVREFEIELSDPESSSEDYWRITLQELVVYARSLEGFRKGALNGLAFGAMGG